MTTRDAAPPTFHEAVAPYLNRWGPYRLTGDEINETAIRHFCEVVEDGNPVYWDRDFAATTRFGRIIAPPQSIFSMSFAPWWAPDYIKQKTQEDTAALNGPDAEHIPAATTIAEQYGYTVNTVATQEVEYIAPFGPGDGRLKVRSMATSVSPEKQTRVGRGVFITNVNEYRTEKGDRLVARSTLVLLKYAAGTQDKE